MLAMSDIKTDSELKSAGKNMDSYLKKSIWILLGLN